ncbi:uncharacterized protein LOC132927832 [Rhopalosiphum padi]|uniref:uncharacterized protein LOC132927832 n=1 Tax=Rhopalosiphum padi TaxID=40932 RepID=UPI00298DCAE8|nr:uncharacterized protein LOC132927832 [Rhopalosiphum padi]
MTSSSSYSLSMSNHIIMAPIKKYSSPSPQYADDTDAQPPTTKPWDITPRQLFSPSFFDGECSQINLTQATYCAQNRESKPKPIDENDGPTYQGFNSDNCAQYHQRYTGPRYIEPSSTSHAVDENDGPIRFNKQPSSPPSLFDYMDDTTEIYTQKNVKRKLLN